MMGANWTAPISIAAPEAGDRLADRDRLHRGSGYSARAEPVIHGADEFRTCGIQIGSIAAPRSTAARFTPGGFCYLVIGRSD
jgi:hypothetical protein